MSGIYFSTRLAARDLKETQDYIVSDRPDGFAEVGGCA